MKKYSLSALGLCFLCQFYFGQIFYPKYKYLHTEATISWDVSGYYFYLPAIFIYKDLKQLNFKEEILKKYQPTPNLQQAYLHDSGNHILKYSIGQSIFYLPWFGLAHIWASQSPDYPADGFSRPYQSMLFFGMLMMAFLGLWVLRKILLQYVSDRIAALTLISLVFGTNYLDYSAINGAMTHNTLFTVYALLLYSTIRFYERPKMSWALAIGGLVGLATLTRPTEIISILIPLFWGLNGINKSSFQTQFSFLRKNISFLIPAALVSAAIGFIQLAYWKYAGGEWIIYSYEDQGFDWFEPHFKKGMFSYTSGWLVYSPILIFALIGFGQLFKQKALGRIALTTFAILFMYLCFAWSQWWYGGSLGQRAMVQSYPILAIPMAFFYNKIFKANIWKWVVGLLIIVFSVYNLWLTREAHKGGVLRVGQMSKAYFWKVLGKSNETLDINAQKLLDTDEEFNSPRKDVKVIFSEDFEHSGQALCGKLKAISGANSLCLNSENKFSPKFNIEIDPTTKWVRVKADFSIFQKEWDIWSMTELFVKAVGAEGNINKQRRIRIQRLINHDEMKNLFMDFSIPDFTEYLEIRVENPRSPKPIMIDNLIVESFH